MQLRVTESALAELRRLLAAEPTAVAIRISVEAGGCAGLTYKLDLASEIGPNEEHLVLEGVSFCVPKAQVSLLEGVQLDWPTGLAARGFVFSNPQAKTTCGCGTSFSV